MAWTSPRTWLAGTKVAAAALNTDVRDNLNWLDRSGLWCRAYLTGAPPTVPDQTDTLIPINTVDAGENPSGMFNTGTHLVTIAVKGLYLVNGGYRMVASGPSSAAPCACSIYKNASGGIPQFVGANLNGTGAQVTRQLVLNPGDTIGLNCWHHATVNISYDLGFGASGNHLSVTCLMKL